MNSNYEWQRQQANQRIQNRYDESGQHRQGKQQGGGAGSGEGAARAGRPTLRLVTAILNLFR